MSARKQELAEIVGLGNVLDDSETLRAYGKDNSFVPARRPRLVVKASEAGQVQQIVQWANRTGTTLIPISSGPPRFRGDTVPAAGGAVVVDLSRMKRILSIDRRNRIAVIEPGLTYEEAQPELAKQGLRFSTPLLPRRSKSVVASLLEREPTIVPKYQWTLMEPLRCLELVWGNGSKMWTGEAGEYSSQNIPEQQAKHRCLVVGMGPNNVDYYRLVSGAQGTMGIVTWVSVKCEVLPGLRKLFFVAGDRLEDLLECTYQIARVRFGDELLLFNRASLSSILSTKSDEIKALRRQLPPWVLLVGIAGRDYLPVERVAFQERDIANFVRQSGLDMVSSIPGAKSEDLMETLLKPSGEPYWKLGYRGGCQDIFFLTNLNKTPDFVKTMYSAAETLNYPISDVGVYIQPQHQGVSCHCEFHLPYAPDDQAELGRVQMLFTRASHELLKEGAFFSRPYGPWAEMVYGRDAGTTMMLRKVKELFDPNNVMNSGKLCF
jgi:FAD/FMN-containing dehydrogenase